MLVLNDYVKMLENFKNRVKDQYAITNKTCKMKVWNSWQHFFVSFFLSLALFLPPLVFLPPSFFSSNTLLSLWVCLSSVRARVWFPSLWAQPASQNPQPSPFLSLISHLPSAIRPRLTWHVGPYSATSLTHLPQIPYLPPPLLVSSLSKDSIPPSSHLCCLDPKHKQVPLFWLIKGRKQGEGGGLI